MTAYHGRHAAPTGRHTIEDLAFNSGGPDGWLTCMCGVTVRATGEPRPHLLNAAFQAHRASLGLPVMSDGYLDLRPSKASPDGPWSPERRAAQSDRIRAGNAARAVAR